MVEFALNPAWSKIIQVNSSEFAVMDRAASFAAHNYFWSAAYKSGRWDGKRHLIKKSGIFPTGIFPLLEKALKKEGLRYSVVEDHREGNLSPEWRERMSEIELTLRDYQKDAVSVGATNPIGIFSCPMGSGKTVIIGSLIKMYGLKTLVLTNRKEMLTQLSDFFRDRFGEDVGLIGDGNKDFGKQVTVAIVNALAANRQKEHVRSFLGKIEHIVADECLGGDTKIYTPSGFEYLKNIKVGDRVCGSFGYTRVVNKWEVEKEAFEVELQSGKKLVMSEDHLVPVHREGNNWVSVRVRNAARLLRLSLDGVFFETIMSMKSLGKRTLYDIQVDSYDHLFAIESGAYLMHNCHHSPSKTFWFPIIMNCANASVRHGFSATPFRTDGTDLLIHAATGPVIYSISTSELIRKNWLARPIIQIHRIDTPSIPDRSHYASVERQGIIENRERNSRIVRFASDEYEQGKSCLVMVNKIDHGKELHRLLCDYVLPGHLAYLDGHETTAIRRESLEKLRQRKLKVVVCTPIWQEGVDIPSLDSGVNAGGGDSDIQTIQKLGRVVRKREGHGISESVDYLDFDDRTHKYLRKHSKNRISYYKSEEEFRVNE